MTSVVPVSGLILARFHVHANEHQTVVDLWTKSSESSGFSFIFMLCNLLPFVVVYC